jgi:hypothetical protein
MSMSNTTENQVLASMLKGTDLPFRTDTNRYLALFTADPTELGAFTDEATYTGYSRVAIPISTGWTDNGSSFANAALLQFGQCTAGSNTVTHFAICTAITVGQLIVSGALNSSLNISSGIQPQFASGSLSVSSD